jgi:hypothetical protein
MPSVGFELTIPVSERPFQLHTNAKEGVGLYKTVVLYSFFFMLLSIRRDDIKSFFCTEG